MSNLSEFKSGAAPSWSATLWDALIDAVEARLGPLEEQLDIQRATAEAIVRRGLEVIELLLAPQVTDAAAKVALIEESRIEALALIQDLLADYEANHLPASRVDETDDRKFVTSATRSEVRDAAVEVVRGGVDVAGDTLSKLYALIVAHVAAVSASNTPFTPTGTIAGGNVQAAIAELDGENQTSHSALVGDISNRVRFDGDQGLSIAQQLQARRNIASATVESSAALGLAVNPFREISQEHGTSSISPIDGVQAYGADAAALLKNIAAGTLAISLQNVINPYAGTADLRRLLASTKTSVLTGQAAFAAGQYIIPESISIEGRDFDPLAWGSGDARSIDVLIIFSANSSGTALLSLRSVPSRSYVRAVPYTSGVNVLLERIPADASGSWAAGAGAALSITLGAVSHSQFHAPSLDAWVGGNYFSHASATNWTSTAGNYFQVAYANVFPIGVLPWTSAPQITGEALHRLLGMRRTSAVEMLRAQRLYSKTLLHSGGQSTGAGVVFASTAYWPTPMRAAPSLSLVGGSRTNVSAASLDGGSIYSCRHLTTSAGAGAFAAISEVITANSRL